MKKVLSILSAGDISRFWSKVDLAVRPDGCLIFTGAKDNDGYGLFKAAGLMLRAHRIAYTLFFGKELDAFGCHHCDNQPCVNPIHIFDGTPKANIHDSIAKGRQKYQHGEDHHHARLSRSDVLRIRELRAAGVELLEIADQFTISFQHVSDITLRKRWRHLGPLTEAEARKKEKREQDV